jgi:hypothetical protein
MDNALVNNQANFFDALAFNYAAGQSLKDYVSNGVEKLKSHQPLLSNILDAMISTWHTDGQKTDLVNLAAKFKGGVFTKRTQQFFTDAIQQVQQQITDASNIIPQFTRWMWDNEVVIGRGVWPKELTDVNAKDINYHLTFRPYYPMIGYEDLITDYQYFTFDGQVVVSFLLAFF